MPDTTAAHPHPDPHPPVSARPTALVTGASAGIGRAFAHRLAADGYRVIAVARDADRLRALTTRLGPGHEWLAADLAADDGLRRTAELIADSRPRLLVNNAGTATAGPFAATPLERAEEMLRLNCRAVTVLTHAFLARARPGDALLNVSSTLGRTPKQDLAVYSATKAFTTSLTEALWAAHRHSGVRVLALCPGMTVTESQRHEDVPTAFVRTPDQVVAAALHALRAGTGPTVVPGAANRLFALAARLLPRRLALALLAREKTGRRTRR
ncbi:MULTISPECIES: SDR family NAD(P)-dependent oxidoreductase [unclassified Streptomyces]|uniref:SDR family NAD(P)-dependent oxidoreductase n=1 Tax=unclassified Streptomyces TaxID=2593676 RepID=UPI002E33F836|nr:MULTISPECIES: SDR family NAD(P)-dependent oxidoreductase [unclassified Streptomyces]WUC63054.1 SDR family NAD(P)-dependent oxidoreductase [Streptomyces sp. NBC_00539]